MSKKLAVQTFKMDELALYHRNPRRGNVDEIAKSLRKRDQYRPIVVNIGTHASYRNEILAGNHTYLAAKKLGWETIQATTVDVDDDEAAQIVLADNRLADLGEYDEDDLNALLQSVDDLEGTGYSVEDLMTIEGLGEPAKETDVPDNAPRRVHAGDIWQLGDHLLMCGDSTKQEDVEKLMGGGRANLLITDPPYGVSLGKDMSRPSCDTQQGKHGDTVIKNDDLEGDSLINFLEAVFNAGLSVLEEGASFYVWHAGSTTLEFYLAALHAGMEIREQLIWKKSSMCLGRADYQWQHEPCMYGWKKGASHKWFSDRKQTTILEFPKPSKSKLHPTMKPVALFDYQIKNSSRSGDVVLDLFGGSGTTIIACEQNGRKARVMELDELYCDVIVQRWEDLSGGEAKKVAGNE